LLLFKSIVQKKIMFSRTIFFIIFFSLLYSFNTRKGIVQIIDDPKENINCSNSNFNITENDSKAIASNTNPVIW